MARKIAQTIENETVTSTLPPMGRKPIRVTKLKDAQRLLSRLITEFQQGNVESRWAKDLCYLINTFVQVTKDTEMEARMAEIESQMEKMSTKQGRY